MSISSAVRLCKRQADSRTHQVKEHPAEMGKYLCSVYGNNYLTGKHFGVVNTGQGRH